MNPQVFVSYTLARGANAGVIRNIVVDASFAIASNDEVGDLIEIVGKRVMPGGWSREDYRAVIALVSWQRLEPREQ